MTDEEIRTSYRDAKYKRMQIRILSELTLKPKEEICQIVGESRFSFKRKRTAPRRWTKEEVDTLCRLHDEGMSFTQIARTLHRPYASVTSKHFDLQHRKGDDKNGSEMA